MVRSAQTGESAQIAGGESPMVAIPADGAIKPTSDTPGGESMRYAVLAAVAACFGMAVSAHAAQFVVNGDFTELSNGPGQIDLDTTATGWSANSGYNYVLANGNTATGSGNVALWTAANGGSGTWNGLTESGVGNFAAMDGDFMTAPLTQTITGLTVGDTYTLSFNYAFSQQKGFDGDTIQSLTASLGSFSDTLPAADGTTLPSHGFSGWSTFSETITADATSETLSFLAKGNLPVPPFALVSDVSLTGGVPEPSTWAMMLVGFGGLGFAAYRSRRRIAAAA
jgi:PEP-CTERM motif